MKTIKRRSRFMFVSIILALLAVVLPANLVWAQENVRNNQNESRGQGMFLGVVAGAGGGVFQYKEGSRTITEDTEEGGLGGLRIGYAFSPKFALSLEGQSFISDNDDLELQLDAVFLAATYRPCSSGFFLRMGIGSGVGEIKRPLTGDQITVNESVAFLFSFGYDWWLNDSLTLGLSLGSLGIDAGEATGFEDDAMGAGVLSVQFNWYL